MSEGDLQCSIFAGLRSVGRGPTHPTREVEHWIECQRVRWREHKMRVSSDWSVLSILLTCRAEFWQKKRMAERGLYRMR